MNGALARFQDDFVESLWAANDALAPHLRSLALQANFPAVLKLVGEEWFRAAAALYVRAQPPDDARLLRYGALVDDNYLGRLTTTMLAG